MTDDLNILAVQDNDWIKLVVFVVLIVISIIVKAIKKAGEKIQESRQQRQQEQEHGQMPQRPAEHRPRYRPLGSVAPEATRPPPPLPRPVIQRPRPDAVDTPRSDAVNTPRPDAARMPRPVRRTPAPLPPEEQTTRVGDELLRAEEHLKEEDMERQHRLEALHPAEADTQAIESRILHITKPALLAVPAAEHHPVVDIHGPQRARIAVLLHEVLSQPKGLRRATELWDL